MIHVSIVGIMVRNLVLDSHHDSLYPGILVLLLLHGGMSGFKARITLSFRKHYSFLPDAFLSKRRCTGFNYLCVVLGLWGVDQSSHGNKPTYRDSEQCGDDSDRAGRFGAGYILPTIPE
jgi:hypothetical protein